MFSSILILFLLPFLARFKSKSSKFLIIIQFFFWFFVGDVLLLGWLGACLVEEPYVIISQCATIFYFSYFFLILPFLGYMEQKILKNH
jgi:ubiquinol-cytochrome c reductase cytochrome b subunit